MSNRDAQETNPQEASAQRIATANPKRADALAQYRGDLESAEKKAARDVNYQPFLPFLAIGIFGVLLAIFLPHAGQVKGYDVLFNSPVAQQFNTKLPERAFSWLALTGGVLLTAGTIVSRSWLVAWVNWFFVGVAWWYSAFAIWIRQSRPVTDPGEGPAYGLIIAAVCLTILFVTLSILLFRKTPLQKALAKARREEAHRDEESRLKQQRLRTGLQEREQVNDFVDDRRAVVAERRRQRRAVQDAPADQPEED
ncbi:hypothetical protein [Corynebacterium auriscanis]|uniref:Rv2732c family membrane protein n=1 Tax=Corynebacterium auriscanis TaxID=99807 RepID=UPI003CF04544